MNNAVQTSHEHRKQHDEHVHEKLLHGRCFSVGASVSNGSPKYWKTAFDRSAIRCSNICARSHISFMNTKSRYRNWRSSVGSYCTCTCVVPSTLLAVNDSMQHIVIARSVSTSRLQKYNQ